MKIAAFFVVFLLGFLLRPVFVTAWSWFRDRILFSEIMSSRTPYLWVLFGGKISQLPWRWGWVHRGWFRCDDCNRWTNREMISRYGQERRNRKLQTVGYCSWCKPKAGCT